MTHPVGSENIYDHQHPQPLAFLYVLYQLFPRRRSQTIIHSLSLEVIGVHSQFDDQDYQ